nr:MAG: hypothetical protein EDM05_00675 [Leptolyngbya sp. IPPAS B-1204]
MQKLGSKIAGKVVKVSGKSAVPQITHAGFNVVNTTKGRFMDLEVFPTWQLISELPRSNPKDVVWG